MSYISVDVDIDDILYDMSSYDRRRFLEHMQDDEIISKSCIVTKDGRVEAPVHIERNASYNETNEFNQALRKLFGNGWKLTLEQEQYIIELAKRF